MERNIKSLTGYTIGATDGEIGNVDEFYFDDKDWIIRYLVVKTGSWLFGRKVLIAPQAVQKIDWELKRFLVNLTKEQVQNSPEIDTDKPVSRQQELELYEHYAWQRYGGNGFYAGGVWAVLPTAPVYDETIVNGDNNADNPNADNMHLRSSAVVTGYNIHATDGDIGHVNDFIIDDKTWQILHFVIDTHNWIGGKKVLVDVKNITDIQWDNSKIILDISVEAVKDCRLFDESQFEHSESTHSTF